METLQKQTLYACGCCKQTLPSDAFYENRSPWQLLQGVPQVRQSEAPEG